MDEKYNSGRRTSGGLNQNNQKEHISRKDNFGSFVQTTVTKESFKENIHEEKDEMSELIYQQELENEDQYNEELESTKSFEIQKDDINEYLDYQSQKTTEIQRIRNEIQNLEREKNLFLQKQSSQRHSFPLQNGSNKNPFKNISIVEGITNSNNLQNTNSSNNKNSQSNPSNHTNQIPLQSNINPLNTNAKSSTSSNLQQDISQNNNSKQQQESLSKNKLKYIEGLSMQRGDYSARQEEDSPNDMQQLQSQFSTQNNQQQQHQSVQQYLTQSHTQTLQQSLSENRANQEEKIRQLESMVQMQNQFMQGFQTQQDTYYARLYGDIKKQFEVFKGKTIKEKKEMEETIFSLKKQLKISQEENQKKQKSLVKILNFYNTLKVDYEKIAFKQQQSTSSGSNQHQLASQLFIHPQSFDIDLSDYGVNQQSLRNFNSSAERQYLSQQKEEHSQERLSYTNMVNTIKEQQYQNLTTFRESNGVSPLVAPHLPFDHEGDLRKSLDSEGAGNIKGSRTTKSMNANPSAIYSKTITSQNGNPSFYTTAQLRDDINIRDSQQQIHKSSIIQSSLSVGNTTTGKTTKQLQMQQNFGLDPHQVKDKNEENEEDINLFCDDDDIVVRQSMENNTKLFDNFFSPRGNTTTQTKYTVTGSTSTSSQEKMFKSDEKILEKQFWSSDLRETTTETQPFSLTKNPFNNQNVHKRGIDQGNNHHLIKHATSLSNQQQISQNQNNQNEHFQSSSSVSSYNSQHYANSQDYENVNQGKQITQQQRAKTEPTEIDYQDSCEFIEGDEDNSFTKQNEMKYSQNYPQSQLFKKALQNNSKLANNPLFLSHNDNFDNEIQAIQKSHRSINNTHSIVGTSIEYQPMNTSQNLQNQALSNVNTNFKIQDSFNKLLSKSLSKITSTYGSNNLNNEMNSSSNAINQESTIKNSGINNNKKTSGSNSSSSQVSGPASSQAIKTQKQSKMHSQNLTISTINSSSTYKQNPSQKYFSNNNQVSTNLSQLEFQPSPKVTQKKKHFPSEIQQYSSLNQESNNNHAYSSQGAPIGNPNFQVSQVSSDGQITTMFKKEKMVTEPSEPSDKSMTKQFTQRQNSSGFQSSQNTKTNQSHDFSQNYNLTDRIVTHQKNNMIMNSQHQNLSYQSKALPHKTNQTASYGQSSNQMNTAMTKRQESQQNGQLHNPNSYQVLPKQNQQQVNNQYQLNQSKQPSHLMNQASQYQIKTVYDSNYLSPTGVSSSKQKNLQSLSQNQLNHSSQLDFSTGNANKSSNNLLQQSSFNNLNKKLLNDKVNKLLLGKKQQPLNSNSANNNSENINNMNTSTSSVSNVGMILSPSSKKQQSFQLNQYNLNNPSSFSKETASHSSKQRLHTLEN